MRIFLFEDSFSTCSSDQFTASYRFESLVVKYADGKKVNSVRLFP